MRRKDDAKHDAIVDAAMYLITTDGFAETSMSKIAKAAKVSPATIYVYFENKEDLLNQLYLTVKEDFGVAVFDGLSDEMTLKESFFLIWMNSFRFFLANPTKFAFHEQFVHSPLISKSSQEQGESFLLPILDLYERGKSEGSLPNISISVCAAILYAPLISLIKSHHQGSFVLTEAVAVSTFERCWKAIQE
ncbi:MAG: TetR/AcrR family transcriptional regulator [Chloroflexota bacterium]